MTNSKIALSVTFVVVFFVGFLPLIMLSRYIIFSTESIERKVRRRPPPKT